ncbi:hypothetical protein PG991_002897, partial [Apiospora marii]
FGHSLGDDKYAADAWTGLVVRSKMNAVLERICGDMNKELQYAFDLRLGTNTNDWKEIDLLRTVRLVVAQAASRFTVGLRNTTIWFVVTGFILTLNAGRDEQYLIDTIRIGDSMVVTCGLAGGMPVPWRSLVGFFTSWALRPQIGRIKRHIKPVYLERQETLKHDPEDPCHSEPQDFFQMMMRFAQKERPHEVDDFDSIARRLIVANFGWMHNTSFQATQLILNILDSNAEFNTISVLRDEFSSVLGKDGDADQTWSKTKVASLTRADSVARETLRLDSFSNRFQYRKAIVDHLVTEDDITLPKGALISMLGRPAHRNAEYLPDEPDKYDPFRFSRAREAAAAVDADGKPCLQNLTFVGTGPQHLPWSHGKHSCPGRFLVEFELKMIMAYLLQNYDIEFPSEYEGRRPPNYWMGEAAFPPADAKIRVKRRPGTTT